MTTTPIVDLDAELGWVARALGVAKRSLTRDGRLVPVAFLHRPGEEMVVVPFFGDFGSVGNLRELVQDLVARHRPSELAFIHDAFAHAVELGTPEGQEAMRRLDEDRRAADAWSAEYKRAVGYRRREALDLFVEGVEREPLLVDQFYRRERQPDGKEAIVWEEVVRSEKGSEKAGFGHPFEGLIRATARERPSAPLSEEEWRTLEALLGNVGRASGHRAVIEEGDEAVLLVRADGTTFKRIPRAWMDPADWARWVDLAARMARPDYQPPALP